jgi:hypothetical protein
VRSALADVIGAAVMVARKLWAVEDIVNTAAPVAARGVVAGFDP